VRNDYGKNSILLAPGQQAQANNNGDIKIISDADMNEAVLMEKRDV